MDNIFFKNNSKNINMLRKVDCFLNQLFYKENFPNKSKLAAAVKYHMNSGGKKIRAQIAIETGNLLKLSNTTIIHIASIVELLHSASLAHDDLLDRDKKRRGIDAVWLKFGDATSLCLGDYLISIAYKISNELVKNTKNYKLLNIIHQVVCNTILGQSLEIEANYKNLSFRKYLKIASLKSGPLLSLPTKLSMEIKKINDKENTLSKITNEIGIAYQIIDDLNDWKTDFHSKSKKLNVMLTCNNTTDTKIKKKFAISRASLKLKSAIKNAEKLPSRSGQPLVYLANSALTLLK